jgi:uncharacterized protein YbcI
MSEAEQHEAPGSTLASLSNAMVRLHKEQFGRGPTKARSGWTNDDTIVTTLEEALLPAERKLVALGQIERVQESRLSFQEATRDDFIQAAQEIVGREVHGFASACDPRTEMIWEIFTFKP